MCGIAGIIHIDKEKVQPAVIKKMTDIIAHRGPDGRPRVPRGRVGSVAGRGGAGALSRRRGRVGRADRRP